MKIVATLLLKIITLMALLLPTLVQANLLITPTRAVFDERTRSTVFTLMNTTTKPMTYRVLWEEKRQRDIGGYIDLETVDQANHPASSMLRQSPRQVTIAPGKFQKVRVSLRRPSNLKPGEYRSHLLFKSIPGLVSPTEDGTQRGQVMQLNANLSFSVPVMVRYQADNVAAKIADIRLAKDPKEENPQLKVRIKREGAISTYGRLVVYMKRPNSSKSEKIGMLNNVAIFRELNEREMTVELQVLNIPKGAVIGVSYEGDDEFEGTTWDQKAIQF